MQKLNLITTFLLVCTNVLILNGHILDETPLIDGHNDVPYNIYRKTKNNLDDYHFENDLSQDPEIYTDIPRLRKGKLSAQFWSAYVDCHTQYKDAVAKTLEQIDVIKRLVNRYPNDLEFITSVEGIRTSFANKKIASLIGVEGGHSIDSRLSMLRMYYDLGVRYLTLTHTCNTPWADNSNVDDDVPVHNLTEFGRLIVLEMNRLGMMVDLAHVSHAVMNQAISVSRAPVIFSHSSAYEITNHHRNVHDDTLLLVKKNKGIVMVNFYSGFVNKDPEKATINDVIDHIDYIVNVAGIESVGIGSDYDGVERMPIGLEDVTKYPDLFDLLQKKNSTRWTKENLKLLAGENLLRVFKEVENIRDSLKKEQPNQQWVEDKDLNEVKDEPVWMCRTLLDNTSPWPNSAHMLEAFPLLVILSNLLKKLFDRQLS